MNNFNNVFSLIKSKCGKEKKFAEINCFETIAKEANIPLDKLDAYLRHLQDIGLIKYSMTDKYIYLTSFGNKHEIKQAEKK